MEQGFWCYLTCSLTVPNLQAEKGTLREAAARQRKTAGWGPSVTLRNARVLTQ